jgi:hypothetical protein
MGVKLCPECHIENVRCPKCNNEVAEEDFDVEKMMCVWCIRKEAKEQFNQNENE